MTPDDRRRYIERYEARLKEFGDSPETLGWGKHGRQALRYSILAEPALAIPGSTVLDVGCGFADLFAFLTANGWNGRYIGIDIVPGLLDVARKRYPELELLEADITDPEVDLPEVDCVISSGVFNAKLDEDNARHIESALRRMLELARHSVAVDFLNKWVDFEKDGAWHTDMPWLVEAARRVSKRFSLRSDYMPFESALILYRDDSVNDRNVFAQIADPDDPKGPLPTAAVGVAPTVSIVTPAYNEEANLPVFFERMTSVMASAGIDWDWWIVDDHSNDATPAVAGKLAAEHPHVHHVRLARNSGSHTAITAGLHHANGKGVVVLSADLQDPPEEIPRLVAEWRNGLQVVWAVRRSRAGDTRRIRLFAGLFYFVMRRFMGLTDLPAEGADFCLIDRHVVRAFRSFHETNINILLLIMTLGFRQGRIEYDRQARLHGTSKWTLGKKIKMAVDTVTAFSYRPMRAMSATGLIFAASGFLWALIVVINWLIVDSPVPGWSSLMVATLILGGIQMMMIGMLGEYLWRTLEQARRRPMWLEEPPRVPSTTGPPDPPDSPPGEPRA